MSEPVRVVTVTVEELEQLVEAVVRRVVAERRPEPGNDDWLDADGVAEMLHVHPRTIGKLAASGEIPSAHVGKLLRFRRGDLLAYLSRENGED